MTMTYKKEIDDVANNDVVLKVAGKIAEILQVPYARVTDAYGGYFGVPSPTLKVADKNKDTAKTNSTTKANTTNTTRML